MSGGGVSGRGIFFLGGGRNVGIPKINSHLLEEKKQLCTLANVNSAENISVNYTLCVKSRKGINKISFKKYVYKLYITYVNMSMLEILKT